MLKLHGVAGQVSGYTRLPALARKAPPEIVHRPTHYGWVSFGA
jgi:hypothetical protein